MVPYGRNGLRDTCSWIEGCFTFYKKKKIHFDVRVVLRVLGTSREIGVHILTGCFVHFILMPLEKARTHLVPAITEHSGIVSLGRAISLIFVREKQFWKQNQPQKVRALSRYLVLGNPTCSYGCSTCSAPDYGYNELRDSFCLVWHKATNVKQLVWIEFIMQYWCLNLV